LQEVVEKTTEKLNQQQIEISELTEKLAKASTEGTDWHRLSDTLQNTLTLVTNSTDHSDCEHKISNLKSENEKVVNVRSHSNFFLDSSGPGYFCFPGTRRLANELRIENFRSSVQTRGKMEIHQVIVGESK
jgi:hypothetical protein